MSEPAAGFTSSPGKPRNLRVYWLETGDNTQPDGGGSLVAREEKVQASQTSAALSAWLDTLKAHACLHPAKDAVIGEHSSLTSAEFEDAVSALARQLREIGLAPGDPVAVCLERSPLTVVAFLAVLRVGAAYLPIDTQYPQTRIAAMLECGPAALIVTEAVRKSLPPVTCPIILAGAAPAEPSGLPLQDIAPVPDDCPAYVMFTSGSTGASNGVVVSRGALARYVSALTAAFDITPEDVYLHTASFSFSASIRQLVAPLTAGAAMVIAHEEARRDPFQLLQLMRRRAVTIWDTVPSLWKIVDSVLSRADSLTDTVSLTNTLRLILLTGEPLSWSLVSSWKRRLGGSVTVINLYSQTETAGTVSMFPIPDGDLPDAGSVPLGKPLDGVIVTVLDEDLNPVQPGQEGEIYVAGDRLADGYRGRDELTASRFLSGFDAAGGKHRRVYRTGDFAQLQKDGTLVPVGRRDHRVKIRGFRVDLLEVETELARVPDIAQAVVLAEDSTRLIAFIVPDAGQHPVPEQIQHALREKLPDYAVPAQIIVIERIPVSPNGKVDRGALLRMRDSAPEPAAKQPAAPDQTDSILLRIWEKALSYKGASLDDEFFAKGGDSLTAVALFLDIEERFGIRLPPSTLLTTGTARNLSTLIRGAPKEQLPPAVLPLRNEGHLPPLFLVHALWEHIPHFKALVKLLDPEIPVYALEPIRNPEFAKRGLDVRQLVKQYAVEVRKTHPEGPYFLAGWSVGGFMAFSVAVELESRGDNPAGLMLIDSMSPSLRPETRRARKGRFRRRMRHLRRLVRRQFESFKLSPADQWARLVWMLGEAKRRIQSAVEKPAARKLRIEMRQGARRLFDQYQPPPYKGPSILFRSEAPAIDPTQDHDLGWSKHLSGTLEIVRLPGDHVSAVVEPRNMKRLAAHISQTIRNQPAAALHRENAAGDDQSVISLFLEETRKLTGRKYDERLPWINQITKDTIRHFASAICDDNPLWSGENDSERRADQPLPAPPTILVAARYPVLHGAPLDLPLISLLSGVEYAWERRIYDGDEVRSTTEQGEVREVVDPQRNRRVHVETFTTYSNARGEVLGRAHTTVIRMLNQGGYDAGNWSVHRYTPQELQRIIDDIHSETRTGARLLRQDEFAVGTRLPSIVRGPLTIGDLVCWHAGIGPSYRPGPLGYKDTLRTPQFRVRNPLTGWPIKYTLQHEDVNLAHQRGMPAPFDNGVMRFAWVSPLITNWMGDHGFLSKLEVKTRLPFFYGDTCWYSGEVTSRARENDSWRVQIKIDGANQHGAITTTGSAEVLLPAAEA